MISITRFEDLPADLIEELRASGLDPVAAVDLIVSGVTEVAVTGERPDLVAAVAACYLPNAVLAWGEPYPSPLWEGRTTPEAADRAFVCRNYTCSAPVTDVDSLLEQLTGALG